MSLTVGVSSLTSALYLGNKAVFFSCSDGDDVVNVGEFSAGDEFYFVLILVLVCIIMERVGHGFFSFYWDNGVDFIPMTH